VKQVLVSLLVAIALVGVTAAQKLEVKTESDPKADFTVIQTYAWRPAPPIKRDTPPDAISNPTLSDEALGPHIIAAVDRQLQARGLRQSDPETADVHVVYLGAISSAVSSSYLGEHYGYITGWGSPVPAGLAPTTSLTGYQKGTIVVDVVQRAANRAIWRGSVETKIAEGRRLEDRIKRIDEAIERIFQRFPIRRRG
jgi:hypothetical protein